MSFGKRNIDKRPPGHEALHSAADAATYPARLQPIRIPRLMVFVVGMTVVLAAVSALSMNLLNPSRYEMVQVEAGLIDGTPATVSARSQLVGLCVEQQMLLSTRADVSDDEKNARANRTCACTFGDITDQLTPLQVRMLTSDQRARLRATMAEIDRTGERIAVGSLPKFDIADGAAVALVTADRYQAYWREARDLANRQAARCRS